MRLRAVHRLSAALLAGFLVLHIVNHLVGAAGQATHIRFMTVARHFYRNPVIEPLLIGLVCWQAISGTILLVGGWRSRRGSIAWVQIVSGAYLAVFVGLHVTAVLIGRGNLLDTDFRFAAAGFQVAGWPWFFAPYYCGAVIALFTHVGCALYWNIGSARGARTAFGTCIVVGAISGVTITASLAGLLHPVDIPERYRAPFLDGQGR